MVVLICSHELFITSGLLIEPFSEFFITFNSTFSASPDNGVLAFLLLHLLEHEPADLGELLDYTELASELGCVDKATREREAGRKAGARLQL